MVAPALEDQTTSSEMTPAIRVAINTPGTLSRALGVIRSGGLLVYPTDTLYGFGCDATNDKAVHNLNRVKSRSGPLSVIAPDPVTALSWTSLPSREFHLIREYLGGPRTVIIPVKPGIVVDAILGPKKTLGIRIPATAFILELAELASVPITTTSVNRTGEQPLNDPAEIMEIFSSDIDLLIDAGPLPTSGGSTIYRWRMGKIELVNDRQ